MKTLKKIRNTVFKLLHPGNKCYCLYCKKSYGKFIHEGVKEKIFKKYTVAGGGYKTNTRCPNCGSVDRARLLALFFELRTKAFKQKTDILHISPNKSIAHYLNQYNTVNQVVGSIDLNEFKEFNTVYADIQKLDLPENSFDIVICCHVIEHVDNDLEAMKQLYKVTKPGGFAVLQVPLALNLDITLEDKTLKTDKERKRAFGQVDHVRLYGKDYFTKLESVGFKVVPDNPFKNQWLPEQELSKHRLDINEDVIVAYKP